MEITKKDVIAKIDSLIKDGFRVTLECDKNHPFCFQKDRFKVGLIYATHFYELATNKGFYSLKICLGDTQKNIDLPEDEVKEIFSYLLEQSKNQLENFLLNQMTKNKKELLDLIELYAELHYHFGNFSARHIGDLPEIKERIEETYEEINKLINDK